MREGGREGGREREEGEGGERDGREGGKGGKEERGNIIAVSYEPYYNYEPNTPCTLHISTGGREGGREGGRMEEKRGTGKEKRRERARGRWEGGREGRGKYCKCPFMNPELNPPGVCIMDTHTHMHRPPYK